MPENSGFMIAAYIVTAVVVLVYTVSLQIRIRSAKRK
jgi:hypothetical protein